MARSSKGDYFLGRVVKINNLTSDKFIEALKSPVVISAGMYNWTITDFKQWNESNLQFVWGKLTKFSPKGQVSIIDTNKKTEISQIEPNLKKASSPFVYLPAFSGIAYLHVWNEIEQNTFVKRFTDLVTTKYEKFWLGCEIDPITDLVSFYKRISEIDKIKRISASVRPPNPLFGHFWKGLKEYLEKRQANELKIDERSGMNTGLKTEIKTIVDAMISKKLESIENISKAIGDEAILMAADGYGKGKIEGVTKNKSIVIHTRESMRTLVFDKDPDPVALYHEVYDKLEQIRIERHMEH